MIAKTIHRIVLCAICPALVVLSTLVGLDIGIKIIRGQSARTMVEQADRLLPELIKQQVDNLDQ